MKKKNKQLKKVKKLTNKQVRKKIMKLVDGFCNLFGLNLYEIVYFWMKEDEENITASVTLEEPYQRISINVYPQFFGLEPREQRKAILHEICHTITLPSKIQANDMLDGKLVTQKAITDMNERTTSIIENILDCLFLQRTGNAKEAYNKYIK